MKRFFISIVVLCLFVLCLLGGVAFATLEQHKVEAKLAECIRSIRSSAASAAINIGSTSSSAVELVAEYGGGLDAADKANLVTLKGKVTAAKAALDDLIDFVDTTWSVLK